ncbi:MAG: acetylglutamate kinase [Acidimicrobiales bacterium]
MTAEMGQRSALRHKTAEVEPGAKAAILAEALPWIRRFAGKVVVIKHGGSVTGADPNGTGAVLSSPKSTGVGAPGPEAPGADTFASDIVLMASVGILPVVVHGGGPQIGDLMARLGKVPEFREGLRVTDADTLDIARMVLVGKVNRDIVGSINVHAPLAVGLSGEDAGLIMASARSADLGFVGDIEVVNPKILQRLLAQGLVPVLATIGSDRLGQAYNVNADTVAGAVAAALGAEKLVFLTDVEGIRRDSTDPASLVRRASAAELRAMVFDGSVEGGMIPKVQACLDALAGGVGHAHILDGRLPHALLLETFTDQGVGTMITALAPEES